MSEHEAALIGRILADESNYPQVARTLRADDFQVAPARNVWLAISELYGKQELNIQNLYLSLDNQTDKSWIKDVTQWITPGEVEPIAEKIKESARVQRLKSGIEVIKKKDNSGSLLASLNSLYRQEVGRENKTPEISQVISRFQKLRDHYREQGGIGSFTGFDTLDKNYICYQPGHLWVIGGNPSVGKTAYMVDSINRAKDSKIAVFSLEMTEEQISSRLLANMTGLNSNAILSGGLIDRHQATANEAEKELSNRKLWIFDDIKTTQGIASQCQAISMSEGLDMIFVDYVQKLNPGQGEPYKVQAEAANFLYDLSKELRMTTIAFSQIPNSAWKEDSGILEFKGAGEWAAACDVGAILKRAKEDKELVLFDARKNRHGPLKGMLLRFQAGFTQLEDEGEKEQ